MAAYGQESRYAYGKEFKTIPFSNLVYPGYQHIPVDKFPNPDQAHYKELTRQKIDIIAADDATGSTDIYPKSIKDRFEHGAKEVYDEDPVIKGIVDTGSNVITVVEDTLEIPKLIEKYKYPIGVVAGLVLIKYLIK